MKITALARSLNLSRQMIYKLAKQGMPVDTFEAAQEWRRRNLHPFKSKEGRFGGNSGLKMGAVQKKESPNDAIIRNAITESLTNIVPRLWFNQVGWLGNAMKDHGVNVSAEQLLKIQSFLFLIYMSEVDDYLETKTTFSLPECLKVRAGEESYYSLVEQLNVMLDQEPKQIYNT